MTVLSSDDRAEIQSKFCSDISQRQEALGAVTQTELRAAIDAADDWVDSNTASFNTALPAAAKAELTVKQKAELLMFVVARRFEVE